MDGQPGVFRSETGMKPEDSRQAAWVRAAMDRYAGPLTRYAAAIVGDPDRAQDVVQDTLARLCREDRDRLEPHLAEWLFTVCRNRALDVLRKENRMTSLSTAELAARPSSAPSPAHEAERRDTHRRVLQELATLPPHQQEVVRLKFQNGLSYEEISHITRLTATNVGFLIHTAIKTLRQRLRTELDLVPHPARRSP
jgi:RNA polymerase sigma factor (sigma-70 family)